MEHNPLRGLFGVSSPRPVEQRVAPQPTEPIENEIPYEYPSSIIEKLLANPLQEMEQSILTNIYALWMIFVDYLSLQVYPMMLLRGRLSLYLWRETH